MEKRNIPFFNYRALYTQNESQYLGVIKEVCERGAFIMQAEMFAFEKALAEFIGVKHAIGVGDGTMALLMGLKASGIQPGDEVLVPSHTFVASAAAIHHCGGVPVLVDSGRDHLIDTNDLERHIGPKTRGIMPVHLNGRTSKMDEVVRIADKHKLFIVEDACQALGSHYNERFAGTWGKCGAFSFYPSKTLGAFGDGGAIVTNDDEIAKKLILLRDHGRMEDGDVGCFGFNSRLDNIQAAVLHSRLKTYREEIGLRRTLAASYHEHLKGVDQIFLPPAPDSDPKHYDIYQNYEIEAEQRDALRQHLSDWGIGTILPWGGKAIHQYAALGFKETPENTEKMTKTWLMLPMNAAMTVKDVEYIAEAVREFYKAK